MADTSISLIAARHNDPHVMYMDEWNYEILKNANEFLDYISMHAYYFYDEYYETGEHFTYTFPAHSVTVFELEPKYQSSGYSRSKF